MPLEPPQPDEVAARPSPPGEAPETLRAALKRAYSPPAALPTTELDDIILRAAHDRLARRRLHPRVLLIGGGLAAAAGLALAVIILSGVQPSPLLPGSPLAQNAGPDDLNGDGRVDILDALALAAAIRDGRAAADLNGDGATDAADVDTLALRIVDLGGAG